MDKKTPTTRWQQVWPFALLCFMGASRWILADSFPASGSTLRSEAAGCFLAAVGVFVWTFTVQSSVPRSTESSVELLRAGLAGGALLAAPALGAALRGAAAQSYNRTAAMCFVPLVFQVCTGIRTGSGMSKLGAPLAGIAGALFLFPLALPVDVGGWVGLFLPPLAVGLACAFLLTPPQERPRGFPTAAFLGGGTCGLLAMDLLRRPLTPEPDLPLTISALGLDLILALLVVLCLRRLQATMYTTRTLWAPVVTVLEGMLIFRPEASLRVWTGVALICVAGVLLWREPRPSIESSMIPRR